jgi:hypothetical protein
LHGDDQVRVGPARAVAARARPCPAGSQTRPFRWAVRLDRHDAYAGDRTIVSGDTAEAEPRCRQRLARRSLSEELFQRADRCAEGRQLTALFVHRSAGLHHDGRDLTLLVEERTAELVVVEAAQHQCVLQRGPVATEQVFMRRNRHGSGLEAPPARSETVQAGAWRGHVQDRRTQA